jgi:hypothetical protein
MAMPSRIQTQLLRRGNNQTNVSSRLYQDGEVVAHASVTLASARRGEHAPAITMQPPSARPDWRELGVAPIGPPVGPRFGPHYEYRIAGAPPFTGAADAQVTGYIREKTPLATLTHAAILGRLDAFYPAFFNMLTAPRPMATVSFMAEFLEDPATLDPTVPLFYRARSIAQASGYVVELRELWHGDTPVALNQQTFAILK